MAGGDPCVGTIKGEHENQHIDNGGRPVRTGRPPGCRTAPHRCCGSVARAYPRSDKQSPPRRFHGRGRMGGKRQSPCRHAPARQSRRGAVLCRPRPNARPDATRSRSGVRASLRPPAGGGSMRPEGHPRNGRETAGGQRRACTPHRRPGPPLRHHRNDELRNHMVRHQRRGVPARTGRA